MLRPGGMLLYSTCTFSPQENEGVISFILEKLSADGTSGYPRIPGIFPRLSPVGKQRSPSEKMCQDLSPSYGRRRAFSCPSHQKDEGTPVFATENEPDILPSPAPSRNRKERNSSQKASGPDKASRALLEDFFHDVSLPLDLSRLEVRNSHVYAPSRGRAGICKRPEVSPLGSVSGRAEKKNVLSPVSPWL